MLRDAVLSCDFGVVAELLLALLHIGSVHLATAIQGAAAAAASHIRHPSLRSLQKQSPTAAMRDRQLSFYMVAMYFVVRWQSMHTSKDNDIHPGRHVGQIPTSAASRWGTCESNDTHVKAAPLAVLIQDLKRLRIPLVINAAASQGQLKDNNATLPAAAAQSSFHCSPALLRRLLLLVRAAKAEGGMHGARCDTE